MHRQRPEDLLVLVHLLSESSLDYIPISYRGVQPPESHDLGCQLPTRILVDGKDAYAGPLHAQIRGAEPEGLL